MRIRDRIAAARRRLRAGDPDSSGAVAQERRPAGGIADCRQRAGRRQRRSRSDAVREGAGQAPGFARGARRARRRELPHRRSRACATALRAGSPAGARRTGAAGRTRARRIAAAPARRGRPALPRVAGRPAEPSARGARARHGARPAGPPRRCAGRLPRRPARASGSAGAARRSRAVARARQSRARGRERAARRSRAARCTMAGATESRVCVWRARQLRFGEEAAVGGSAGVGRGGQSARLPGRAGQACRTPGRGSVAPVDGRGARAARRAGRRGAAK